MVMTDPIADMLTRLRNATMVNNKTCDVPYSTFKKSIANVLKQEGFILGYDIRLVKNRKMLRFYLKYAGEKDPIIKGIKRESKPGRRLYVGYKEIPYVFDGLGVNILSTSKGMMSGVEAKKRKLGGELICSVW
ncbi:MAG: 30S ribosomal protein S8 [bacterium]|nr:30S ribosomal protein S8 [bacterium]